MIFPRYGICRVCEAPNLTPFIQNNYYFRPIYLFILKILKIILFFITYFIEKILLLLLLLFIKNRKIKIKLNLYIIGMRWDGVGQGNTIIHLWF